MGFFEDDRVRGKNFVHNQAFEILEGLRYMGYTPQEIIAHAELGIHFTNDPLRNQVLKTVIELVRGTHDLEEEPKTTDTK